MNLMNLIIKNYGSITKACEKKGIEENVIISILTKGKTLLTLSECLILKSLLTESEFVLFLREMFGNKI